MCATAHGWVGLGSIVYLSSGEQLSEWLKEIKAPAAPIQFLPIEKILKNGVIKGPGTGKLLSRIKRMQLEYHENTDRISCR